MKKKFRSLKFDLIVDLSILTLCALILSEGVFILLIRFQVPQAFGNIATSYLKPLHESFSKSVELDKTILPNTLTKKADSVKAFDEFIQNKGIGKGWAEVKLKVSDYSESEDLVKIGKLHVKEEKSFFLIPVIYEFQYVEKGPQNLTFTYAWSISPFHASLSTFKYQVFGFILLILLSVVAIGYFFFIKRTVLQPLHNLNAVARAYLKGNWKERCSVSRKDEFGNVAEALNQMGQKIDKEEGKLILTIKSLQKANAELEVRQNEQLQIEKLASIGRLAAGVAHEVGNPLGAVTGYVDILKRSFGKNPTGNKEDLELCDRIEGEINRITGIIRALLKQARPAQDKIKGVEILPVVRKSIELAQIPSFLKVTYEFEDEKAQVLAEEDQLVQIFLNLLLNAKHAVEMKKGSDGELKIQCGKRRLPVYNPVPGQEDKTVMEASVVKALEPKTYWVTTFVDNGIGINPEDQKKLF